VAITIAALNTDSLAMIATPNQIGIAPLINTALVPTTNKIRSVAGSNTAPKALLWENFRATQPSTQSLMPSTPSSNAARAVSSRASNSHRKTGRQHRRTAVIRLGTVNMLRVGAMLFTPECYKPPSSTIAS